MFNFKEKLLNKLSDDDQINKFEEKSNEVDTKEDPQIDYFSKEDSNALLEKLGIFFTKDEDEELEEEDDDPDMEDFDLDYEEEEEDVKNTYFGNYSALDFIAKGVKCHLDDLAELLTTSGKYKTALAQIEETGKLFVDPEFNHDAQSLYGHSEDFNRRNQMNAFSWNRSDVYFGDNPSVYETLSTGDIIQGQLGDCYYLAAISSIAEHPERLKRLFLTKTNEKNGLFAVALCVNGVWEEVILDDYAPCNSDGTLAFNTSKEKELWVVLLEKAWAKVHGGYLNIEAGLTREALRDLTGASAKTYFTKKNPDALWSKLMEAESKQFIMTAGSDNLSGGSDAYIAKIGISGSHAYSLLAVYQIKYARGDYKRVQLGEDYDERIVKLRNPWGSGEWKGEWSDQDDRWTEGLKTALGFTGNKDDGIFFIKWEDFLTYFSDVQICYYYDEYKYSAEKFESKRNETVFLKFTIEKEGLYYFSVNQRNRRFYPRNAGYKYSHIGWVLGQIDGEDSVFKGSGLKADKENWQAIECVPGTYYAMVHTPWRSLSREFSYSVYGPGLTEIERVNESDLPDNFINEIFMSKARSELEQKGRNFAHRNHPGVKYISSENNGWAYVYFKNEEEDNEVSITLKLGGGNTGVRVLPPYSGGNPSFTLSPGEQDIVLYKNNGKTPTSVSMMTSFRKVAKVDLIKKQVQESNIILKKRFKGEIIKIKVYFLYHEQGIYILYINETNNLTLSEDLQLDLDNAHIEGMESNSFNVSLAPGKEKLVKVVQNKEGPFNARISKMKYTITQKGSMFSNNKW